MQIFKIVRITVLFSILTFLSIPNYLGAWNETVTHPDLSEMAARKSMFGSQNYPINVGFSKGLDEEFNGKKLFEWIRYGAELEDAGSKWEAITGKARFNNHFHNPLKSWTEAGLDDWVGLHYTGESSLLWAQDGGAQLSIVEGVWTWQMARHDFYLALTATLDSTKQENFAKTFRGLGHQMHLLQDTAVPDHVRNDAHPEDELFGKSILNGSAYFESWAKNNPNIINVFAASPIYPNVSFNVSYNGLSPVTQLFDAELYDGLNASAGINQGLAEYTNANFFSGDTTFAAERYSQSYRHYFPFPKKSSTDLQSYISGTKPVETFIDFDGSIETGTWISKLSDGETFDHLLKTSIFTRALYFLHGENEDFYNSFYRDEKCHEDYASKLIPRAVGYSAGLLDYFFRGTIEITAPDEHIYSIIDGSVTPQQFTRIKAKARNSTQNEAMTDGSLLAVAKYKIIPNYDPYLDNYPPDGTTMKDVPYSYSVSSAIVLIPEQLGSMNMYPTEFTFDFTNNPIPAGVTDLYLQVIFKGTLGNEKDTAVAVGMKDLKEPNHHVFWNLTDMYSLDNHLYTAEQIRNDPDLMDLAGNAYIDPYPMDYEIFYMAQPSSPALKAASVNNLPAGRQARLITLIDSELEDNYLRLKWSDNIDNQSDSNIYTYKGVMNEEINGVWQMPTPLITFRNTRQHFKKGMLRCQPVGVDPVTGNLYCYYPDSEAIPADTTPIPVTINFQ